MVTLPMLTDQLSPTDKDVNDALSVGILGSGPTGALLALGLSRLGCRVQIHDPLSADQISSRSRAYAITHSSRRLLERLDLWTSLQPYLVPFRQLCLQDQWSKPSVWFRIADLAPANRNADAIGWILDHQPLMQELLKRLDREANVALQLGDRASSGVGQARDAGFDLIVAADGPKSSHRQAWRLPLWSFPYRQGCLTLKVSLRGAAPATAHEYFRAEGPFAVLPLGGQAFQLVWSAPLNRCRERAALDPSTLLDLLATVLPSGLEPEALLDQPVAVPLQWSLAPKLARGRQILLGEAGHRCHPVGGQGLNLCWRDVDELIALVAAHQHAGLALRQVSARYSRRRLVDLFLIGAGTDVLLRLFSNSWRGLRPVRFVILLLIQRLPLLRRIALQVMTDGPMTILKSPSEWKQRGFRHGVQQ